MKLLISLAGMAGQGGLILAIGLIMFPAVGWPMVLLSVALGYGLSLLILLSVSTLIETLVVMLLWFGVLLWALLAAGDKVGPALRLLIWALLAAACYLPILTGSMACLFPGERALDKGDHEPHTPDHPVAAQPVVDGSWTYFFLHQFAGRLLLMALVAFLLLVLLLGLLLGLL